MRYKEIVFNIEGFRGKELNIIKKLGDNFLSSNSKNEYGIVGYELKYSSTHTKLFKARIAIFNENQNGKFCVIKNTYAITDLEDNLILVYPSLTISPKKHPIKIDSGDLLVYDKFGLLDIPIEALSDLSNLKEKLKKEQDHLQKN